MGPLCRGPVWMPITPKRGSFLHADLQSWAETCQNSRPAILSVQAHAKRGSAYGFLAVAWTTWRGRPSSCNTFGKLVGCSATNISRTLNREPRHFRTHSKDQGEWTPPLVAFYSGCWPASLCAPRLARGASPCRLAPAGRGVEERLGLVLSAAEHMEGRHTRSSQHTTSSSIRQDDGLLARLAKARAVRTAAWKRGNCRH